MFRRFILFVFIFSSFFTSCARITSEFNNVEDDDKEFVYKLAANSGEYYISCYSTQSGGYGTYGQLIRDYTFGSLSSIVNNDDTYFSIKSNSTDSKSTTSNQINFSLTFSTRDVNSISVKAVYSALEDSYVASKVITSLLGLTGFTIYVTDENGKEQTLASLKSSFNGSELEKEIKVGYKIQGVRVNATMTKYYGNYSSSKYSDLSYQQTNGTLSIYKVILN
jgi:hypothetical protein